MTEIFPRDCHPHLAIVMPNLWLHPALQKIKTGDKAIEGASAIDSTKYKENPEIIIFDFFSANLTRQGGVG
jgi:hypothetical protein